MTIERPSRRTIFACVLATLAGAAAGIGVGIGWDDWTDPASSFTPNTTSPLLAFGMCGERLQPDPAVPSVTVGDPSTAFDTPIRNRQIELRAQRHPEYGWIVWAELVASASPQDHLWLDWTYTREQDTNPALWRMCEQPVTAGRATPALRVYDDHGRSRWFQACGQVPPQDRGSRASGTFCTQDWNRPN